MNLVLQQSLGVDNIVQIYTYQLIYQVEYQHRIAGKKDLAAIKNILYFKSNILKFLKSGMYIAKAKVVYFFCAETHFFCHFNWYFKAGFLNVLRPANIF
jgi:hypothetical protein